MLVVGNGSHSSVVTSTANALGRKRLSVLPVEDLDSFAKTYAGTFRAKLGLRTEIFVAIGTNYERQLLIEQLYNSALFRFPTLIHPTAVIAPSARIGDGSLILPHAHIGPSARVGMGCVVGVGASLDHHSSLGNFASLGPGAHTGGNVAIGARVFVGMAANVIERVSIGDDALVGASSLVLENVAVSSVVYGVPAVEMRRREKDEPYFQKPKAGRNG